MFDLQQIVLTAAELEEQKTRQSSGFGGLGSTLRPSRGEPLLWLVSNPEADPLISSVFLVNNTAENLDYVNFGSASTITIDNDAYGGGTDNQRYDNVPHGAAVKIEQIDAVYDSDFSIYIYVQIKSALLGERKFTHCIRRGKLKSKVLLWQEAV
ncbi:hypothetical protein [Shewanella algae]|uniref:hypothetical protein n=1 Tax=Shewanella algae TaxID=38313 RepID=UPI00313D0DF2